MVSGSSSTSSSGGSRISINSQQNWQQTHPMQIEKMPKSWSCKWSCRCVRTESKCI